MRRKEERYVRRKEEGYTRRKEEGCVRRKEEEGGGVCEGMRGELYKWERRV